MVNRMFSRKAVGMLLLLSVVTLAGCALYEEHDLAVENGTGRTIRVVVEGGDRPAVTFILHRTRQKACLSGKAAPLSR